MNQASRIASFLARQDFYPILLAALIISLVVMPIMEQTHAGRLLFNVGLTFVLIVAAGAIRRDRGAFAASTVVTIVAIPLLWLTMISQSSALYLASHLVGIALIALAAMLILNNVIRRHLATMHAILGTICVYLLLGQGWALAYSVLDHVQDEPFAFAHQRTVEVFGDERDPTSYSQLVYFSFVTMTTLGYGDVSPRSAEAETLTWLQAVAGQFYIAILVARFVNAVPQIPAGSRESSGS